jgi:hypothetical protein
MAFALFQDAISRTDPRDRHPANPPTFIAFHLFYAIVERHFIPGWNQSP